MAVSSTSRTKTASLESVNELLEKLVARVPEVLLDTDVTPARLQHRLALEGKKVSRSWALRWLDTEVEEGRLVKVPIMLSRGGKGFAYREPE